MICTDRSCPGCHFNKPNKSPRLKFHQEVGCPAITKHGYVCKKDVTEAAMIVERFNSHFPKPQPHGTRITGACRATEDAGPEDTTSAIQVHYPSIPPTLPALPTLPDHPVPPSVPPYPAISHLTNQVSPPPSLNGFTDLYLLDSEDDSVFGEMVGNDKINPIKPISSYIISPLVVSLEHLPPKVAKKRQKTLHRHQLASVR